MLDPILEVPETTDLDELSEALAAALEEREADGSLTELLMPWLKQAAKAGLFGAAVTPSAPIGPTPLSAYNRGDAVTVMRNGSWVHGEVSHRDKVSNHVHVDTERGPVTIATPRQIRR